MGELFHAFLLYFYYTPMRTKYNFHTKHENKNVKLPNYTISLRYQIIKSMHFIFCDHKDFLNICHALSMLFGSPS